MRQMVISLLALILPIFAAHGKSETSVERTIAEQIRQSWKEASAGNHAAVVKLDFGLARNGEALFGDYVIAVAASDGGPWEISTVIEQARLLKDDHFELKVEPQNLHVMLLGSEENVAYASYYLVGTVASSADGTQDYHTRVSQVFERIEGKWVIRGAHYSRFMDAAGIPQSR